MKKCAFIIAMVFICTNAYAIDMPWFKKPAEQKPKPPAKVVVVKPVPLAKVVVAPAKVVVVNPAPVVKPVIAVPQPAPVIPPAPQRKLTREEMIARITEVMKSRPNIASAVQGLVAQQEGGVTVYMYNGKKLEDLDEETLSRILAMISQQISLDNLQRFDRQQRQLKNLQQIDRINKTQRMLQQQRQLTKPAAPKIYTPPKVPRTRY